jgi:ankyrin repeat protein
MFKFPIHWFTFFKSHNTKENNSVTDSIIAESGNVRFYNTIERSDFENQAKLCGILVSKHGETDRCVDLETVISQLSQLYRSPTNLKNLIKQINLLREYKQNGRVLIVGAGFGREIQWLDDNASPEIDIYAFDNAQTNIDAIKNRFNGKRNLKVFLKDVQDTSIKEWGQFDLILWMWSGLPELDNTQKQVALSNLESCLNQDGILVIESLDFSKGAKSTNHIQLSNEETSKQISFKLHTGEELKLEFVGTHELHQISKTVGLDFLCDPISYLDGKRQLYFLKKNKDDKTSLHVATFGGHLEVVKYLIEKGVNVNTRNLWSDKTPLHWAARGKGKPPLHWAACGGNLEMVKYLIEKGTDVNTKNKNETTPLHWAAFGGHFEVVKYLIEKGADVNVKDKYDNTPLHLAAMEGHLEIVKYLIEKGVDVNAKNKGDEITPLHAAASGGHLEVVKYLIEKDAVVNTKNKNNETPLHAAVNEGHLEVVEYLIEKGADVNVKDKYANTPLQLHLHLAAFEGHLEVVKYLIEKGADVNTKNKNDETPLHKAALRGHLEIIKYLIEKGADVNTKNNDDETPLYLAMSNGYQEVVEYLMKKGADVNTKNENDETPLHKAAHEGHLEVVEYLIEKGAYVNTKNKYYGETPLHKAAFEGHLEVVK